MATVSLKHAGNDPFEGVNLGRLERSLMRPRTLFGVIFSSGVTVITCVALVPLFSVLWMLGVRGSARLGWAAFTQLPPAPLDAQGGFGNALLGTTVMVVLAGVLSVPLGVLTGVFLSEAEPESRFASGVRFAAKVLTGLPSILAGVFAYGSVVLLMGGFSAIAGALALSILMLPTIVLSAEEAMRSVPKRIREAAVGMGTTPSQTVWMVTLPAAGSGILTGIMLAVARAAGETAPLLFTALFSNYWITSTGALDLKQPTASLAVLIFNFAGVPFENQVELAWAAALVLVLMVFVSNLAGRALSSRGRSA
ncbi:MAG: phosphate ABC transporter permease PstA [Myxococcales bacterium]